MKATYQIVCAFYLLFLTGCAVSVHQVQVSDFSDYVSISKGKDVSANTEQFVVFGFVDNVHYVENAVEKLKRKCPRGQIIGITTEYMTELGFFSWKNKVYLKGRCIKS
tara:strand:+ start:250 stop:573 length:324 start_codon:yes stop_codon:yes gene_type:complete